VNLWKSLGKKHGFQTPTGAGVEEKVLREFRVIYDRLEEAKPLIPKGRFYELRYEDYYGRDGRPDPAAARGRVARGDDGLEERDHPDGSADGGMDVGHRVDVAGQEVPGGDRLRDHQDRVQDEGDSEKLEAGARTAYLGRLLDGGRHAATR